ncbi:MAG: hypothetical protein ACFFCY_17520 [Promethearchaeota archaeon]
MKVYISNIEVIEDKKFGGVSYRITGQLQSGLEIKINDLFYDLREYIGCYVEMLLCVLRSPYGEQKKGMNNHYFLPEEYYSENLINELKAIGLSSKGKERYTLTGEYIESHIIPEKWISLIEPKWFKRILKEPSVIKTEDGIFLLYPFHIRKNMSIKSFPKKVTIITGCIDLAAWYPL